MFKQLFLRPEILSQLVFTQKDGKYYVQATTHQKPRPAFPEEIIRQIFIASLLVDYHYPEHLISLEHSIQMGREKKRADIVIIDENGVLNIVIEVKVDENGDSISQLKSYMAISGAKYGGIISGNSLTCIYMLAPNEIKEINDLPVYGLCKQDIDKGTFAKYEANNGLLKPTRESIGIERFKRYIHSHAEITINGCSLKLSNTQIESYKILRKNFLGFGIVLDPQVQQSDWHKIFKDLLENTPIEFNARYSGNSTSEFAAKEAINTAIKSFRAGFKGGWISSVAVTQLFENNKIHIPRNGTKDLLFSMGFIYHPSLKCGRLNNSISDYYGRNKPKLYITPGHPDSELSPSLVGRAYEMAQSQVVQENISPTLGTNDKHANTI
jgi:hypothetical protein